MEEKLNQSQMKRIMDALFQEETDEKQQFVADLTDEEYREFLEACPEFASEIE